MKKILNKIWNKVKKDLSSPKSNEISNEEIISLYHKMKDEWNLISEDEPNYDLARKVFLEFNEFNLRNLKISPVYLQFVPKSLLPYPKNYIKCAYYIFLEKLKKDKNLKMFNAVQEVGTWLFFSYPDFEKYQENLKQKSLYDDVAFKDSSPREAFKKLYGSYQILKEEYDSSPSSIDATNEKLIYDFGVLPEIEADVDSRVIIKNRK